MVKFSVKNHDFIQKNPLIFERAQQQNRRRPHTTETTDNTFSYIVSYILAQIIESDTTKTEKVSLCKRMI